jgi:ABC-type branched-subunit amino acid transport system ATPase component
MRPDAQPARNIGPVLECNQIIVRRGARLAVGLDDQQQPAGFSLQIRSGEVLLLQAPNGWGKTTLFDAICGNEALSAGTLQIKGQDATTMPTWDRYEQGLSACQAGARLFGRLDVEEVSQLARLPEGCLHHLSHLKGKRLDEMSGGERQFVAVSIAIETARLRPGLLLLDEPLAMLDASAIRMVLDRLSTLSSAVLILMPATQ